MANDNELFEKVFNFDLLLTQLVLNVYKLVRLVPYMSID